MWYNLPTKIFEYGAGTRPTVAPDSPTVRSLFEDGHDLLLFNERDPKSLVRAIESLVREPKLRQRLGAALGEKIRAVHTRDAMAAFYAELLGGVADGRCKRSARL